MSLWVEVAFFCIFPGVGGIFTVLSLEELEVVYI